MQIKILRNFLLNLQGVERLQPSIPLERLSLQMYIDDSQLLGDQSILAFYFPHTTDPS